MCRFQDEIFMSLTLALITVVLGIRDLDVKDFHRT